MRLTWFDRVRIRLAGWILGKSLWQRYRKAWRNVERP